MLFSVRYLQISSDSWQKHYLCWLDDAMYGTKNRDRFVARWIELIIAASLVNIVPRTSTSLKKQSFKSSCALKRKRFLFLFFHFFCKFYFLIFFRLYDNWLTLIYYLFSKIFKQSFLSFVFGNTFIKRILIKI